jgi:hypothetical protein
MAKIADHINKVKKKEENEKRVKHLQTSLYGWKGNDVRRVGGGRGEGGRGEPRERETIHVVHTQYKCLIFFLLLGSRQPQCVWRTTVRSKLL